MVQIQSNWFTIYVNSPVLLNVGVPGSHASDPSDPTTLNDVFFRIGGAAHVRWADARMPNDSFLNWGPRLTLTPVQSAGSRITTATL